MKIVLALILTFGTLGCASTPSIPDTLGDPKNAPVYGYHPLDPLPVKCFVQDKTILASLPNETIRMAIASVSKEGKISFGTATAGAGTKHFIAILDYIKFNMDYLTRKEEGKVVRVTEWKGNASNLKDIVPVYVGVGLRLTADFTVKKGNLDLGSLMALGLAAKAEKISGTLVFQTLGISGPEISGLVPMPSEISEASIQNAIIALASIKAKMYDENTAISPGVVGVYNTLGGGETMINSFIASLLNDPPECPNHPTPPSEQ